MLLSVVSADVSSRDCLNSAKLGLVFTRAAATGAGAWLGPRLLSPAPALPRLLSLCPAPAPDILCWPPSASPPSW